MRFFIYRLFLLLSNPWVLLCSLVLGVYIGLDHKDVAAMVAPIADIYIELLKMVLIPFMISAIVVSLARLFGSHTMRRHVGPILTTFIFSTAAVALFGVISAVTLSPGADISTSSRQTLGELINKSPYAVDLEVALDTPKPPAKEEDASDFFNRLIPDNIFQALTVGDNLKILFFAIAFGIGLGSLRANREDGLVLALGSVYDVCRQIIVWVNLVLPLALCAMVAKQVATVGAAQILAMFRFSIGFGAVSAIVCLASVLIIAMRSGAGLSRTLKALREPFLLAIATRSSITCIPAASNALVDIGFDRAQVELFVPLGITLFRFGPILYYAFSTVFVAQLYDVHVSLGGYALIFLGALLTGLASAGTTGVLTISLLGVVFQPLGLPLEAALALLVTIDPIIDIFRTVAIVLPNVAAASVIYRVGKHELQNVLTPAAE